MTVGGFEQFEVGQVFASAPQTIDAAAIKAFAAEFDHQAQHTEEAAAKGTMFGTLVASGWHTAAFTMRLLLESVLSGISGRCLGVKVADLNWTAPVYPGDALYVVTEIMEVRPSRSKLDRGLVVLHSVTRNQHDVPVQDQTSTILVLRSDATL